MMQIFLEIAAVFWVGFAAGVAFRQIVWPKIVAKFDERVTLK
jgi:hypothetical protein